MKIVYLLFILSLGAVSCKREKVFAHNGSDPPSQMQIALQELKTGLNRFEIDCGHYPSTAENLSALVVRPTDIPEGQWHGPYLASIPKDQWGHDFIYRCPGIHNTNGYDFYSCGPDGVSKSGGDDPDDIHNW